MSRKAIVMAAIIAAMATAGVAVSADNSASATYFEGVWGGEWAFGRTKQDVTITIGEKNEKGNHKTTYDYGWWETGTGGSGAPGSFVVYGRERDGAFAFWWKDKEGTKRTVTLQKFQEDAVKARMEREGPATSYQRPYYDAVLKRK